MNTSPARNVFACLVHESQECVIDLVRNLHFLDPSSVILLYNGGHNTDLLKGLPFESFGAIAHPSSKPMEMGRLHHFALDCMQFALERIHLRYIHDRGFGPIDDASGLLRVCGRIHPPA